MTLFNTYKYIVDVVDFDALEVTSSSQQGIPSIKAYSESQGQGGRMG